MNRIYFVDYAAATDPCLNLALEEYLLRHVVVAEPMLLFYVNEPAVVLGRNQNVWEEIDPDYVRQRGVHVVRRLSGGGAVYHDLGNLNFSYITNGAQDLHNFHRFTGPVIRALNGLGVPAVAHGKSDIYVNGRKISGNAQYLARQRMVTHGTILFDSDLEALLHALNPRRQVIESKAVQSIRARVTNIKEWLPQMDMTGLRRALLARLIADQTAVPYPLTAADWVEVRRIRMERYDTWEWNYGRSPRCLIHKTLPLPGGPMACYLEIEKGRIKQIGRVGEDGEGNTAVGHLSAHLSGVAYHWEALAAALNKWPDQFLWPGLSAAELLALLY